MSPLDLLLQIILTCLSILHVLGLCYGLNWINLAEQVSMGYGTVTAHALMTLEARGILFVKPGMEVVIVITFSSPKALEKNS